MAIAMTHPFLFLVIEIFKFLKPGFTQEDEILGKGFVFFFFPLNSGTI